MIKGTSMALILLIRALNVKSFNLAYVLFYCTVLCYAYANSTSAY